MKLIVVLLLGVGLSGIHAQTAVISTGSNISGSGGSATYSVGQVVYPTNTGTNGSVAQGVQQPYEIFAFKGIDEAKGVTLSAYPNPTTEYLILQVKDIEVSLLQFQLYDMKGNLLQSEEITSIQTSIFMGNLIPATYFVKVIQGNTEVIVFKIIKK